MEKINVAELLKDCPKGMELDCTMYENVYFEELCEDESDVYPITINICHDDGNYLICLTKEGCWSTHSDAKCVIYPKGKTTWEGFQRPFKNGDVVCTDDNNIAILGDKIEEYSEGFYSYCGLFNYTFNFDVIVSPKRLATEEEKAKLFQTIKDNGYKWNAETKTLEKLIQPKFKVGDRIVKKNGIRVPILITKVVISFTILIQKVLLEYRLFQNKMNTN